MSRLPYTWKRVGPSQLAMDIIQQVRVQPRDWSHAFRLAQLILAMDDFTTATNGFLNAAESPQPTLRQLFSLVRWSGNALAGYMGDLLWLGDFADTYSGSPNGALKSTASRKFPYDLWDRMVVGFQVSPSEQLRRVKSHLADVYEDCSAILESFESFRARRISHDELFWGDSGLIQARIHTLHHLVGLPGGFAGLLADMAVLEEGLFDETEPTHPRPEGSQ